MHDVFNRYIFRTFVFLIGTGLVSLSGCKKSAPLEEKVVSEDPAVRTQAIQKISNLSLKKQIKLVSKLIPYIKNPDSRVVSRALNGMAVIGSPAVPQLSEIVSDTDVFVRLGAVVTLGQMGPTSAPAASTLAKALRDPHPLVRQEAAFALGEIGAKANETISALQQTAKTDANSDVRAACEEALQKIEKKEGPGA